MWCCIRLVSEHPRGFLSREAPRRSHGASKRRNAAPCAVEVPYTLDLGTRIPCDPHHSRPHEQVVAAMGPGICHRARQLAWLLADQQPRHFQRGPRRTRNRAESSWKEIVTLAFGSHKPAFRCCELRTPSIPRRTRPHSIYSRSSCRQAPPRRRRTHPDIYSEHGGMDTTTLSGGLRKRLLACVELRSSLMLDRRIGLVTLLFRLLPGHSAPLRWSTVPH